MSDYIIEGGRKLEGEVEISGSKNAAPLRSCTKYTIGFCAKLLYPL